MGNRSHRPVSPASHRLGELNHHLRPTFSNRQEDPILRTGKIRRQFDCQDTSGPSSALKIFLQYIPDGARGKRNSMVVINAIGCGWHNAGWGDLWNRSRPSSALKSQIGPESNQRGSGTPAESCYSPFVNIKSGAFEELLAGSSANGSSFDIGSGALSQGPTFRSTARSVEV